MNLFRTTIERLGSTAFLKHIERVFDRVNWTGVESLLLSTPTDMFKGWDKTNNITYEVGNVFKRSVNGVSVKFITRIKPTQNYTEPWEANTAEQLIFQPIQYLQDSDLNYIYCNWIENEYIARNSYRYCPEYGKLYRAKMLIERSSIAPSLARAADNTTWQLIEVAE